ncbi:MAG: hypothetical protein H6564_17405 [Lewinellaceae bacterium]|nr:hypothetical protein [Lewinellaceae bacterium]
MYNSKLYSILEHFDKYEQNRCRKYIQSPYFNRSDELMALFEIFLDAINNKDPNILEKDRIWEGIQPDKPYDDVRFRKYCSDLLKLVEGFLAQQTYENRPLQQATYLMEAVGKKKVPELYSSAMRTARRLSEKQPYRSATYYYHQYSIEQNYYYLTEFETKRSDRTNIEDIANNLDVFYLAEKLRILCAAITQQTFVAHDYELLFVKEIIQHVNSIDFEKHPPVALYYQIYLTLTETEKEEHYYRLKYLLDKYSLKFPPNEAKDVLYMAAQNYCIRKINQGNHSFTNELFLLYQDLIDKKILFTEGELSPWYFKNIVNIALRLGKYTWAENFITTYSEKLPESFRSNAVTYNLAQVYFFQRKYDKVLEQLRNVEYEDVAYNLGSKAMLLATYYEIEELEPLYSLFDSFRAFLNRHKDIPVNRRKNYSNLIKFTKKLTRTMPGDQKALSKLKEEIQATRNIASVNWLREKISELE